MSVTKSPAIAVTDVSYAYGSAPVLTRVSFTIADGTYVGIIGPNGGGKTTLLKLLLGLMTPASGSITLFGDPVAAVRDRHEIGYVPQRILQDNIRFPATIDEIVASGRGVRVPFGRQMTSADHQAIESALEIADIKRLRHRRIGDVSGGERQRVFVARALAAEPRLLLLDEPFTGVDISAQQEFYTFLKALNTDRRLTIVFVSHDIDVISKEVHELLCLNKRLVCQGAPDRVIEKDVIEQLYGRRITHIHHDHV